MLLFVRVGRRNCKDHFLAQQRSFLESGAGYSLPSLNISQVFLLCIILSGISSISYGVLNTQKLVLIFLNFSCSNINLNQLSDLHGYKLEFRSLLYPTLLVEEIFIFS